MLGGVFPPLQWGNLQREPILLYMLSFHGINGLNQHYKVSLLHAILQYWKKLQQELRTSNHVSTNDVKSILKNAL